MTAQAHEAEGFPGRVLGTAAKRELVRAALLENPGLSHNAIARQVGVSNHFVTEVCAGEVGTVPTSGCRHGLTGQGARTDRQPRSSPGPDERAEEAGRADPVRPDKQIQADLGLPAGTHRPDETAMTQPYEVIADTWLDGTKPWQHLNGQVPQRVIAGTHVVLHPGDDATAMRYGGWGNLRPASGQHGTSDGRGVAAAARPAPPRAMRVHGEGGRVAALWEA
jgi:hypothetical protein